MDIAKIRKKLRESEAEKQPPKANGQMIPTPEDRIPPDEKISEPVPAEKIPELREKEESSQETDLQRQEEQKKPEEKQDTAGTYCRTKRGKSGRDYRNTHVHPHATGICLPGVTTR